MHPIYLQTMSLIFLDFRRTRSGSRAMESISAHQMEWRLTTTQIGAIGEDIAATQLMLASGGRLTPFKPCADDDGVDLLVFDKATRRSATLQIKTRMKLDDPRAQTVQFDVRKKTYSDASDAWLLALLLNGADIQCCWLIPMQQLPDVSRDTATNFSITPSAKASSNDRYTGFRHHSFSEAAMVLTNHFNLAG